MFYTYWNDFIKKWFSGCKNIDGWTEPAGKLSSHYIPEPWWGNDDSQPLHSIVVNFNPGKGGFPQKRENLTKVFKSSYANDIVNNTTIQSGSKEWPNCTRNWNLKKRAIPILQHLDMLHLDSEFFHADFKPCSATGPIMLPKRVIMT